MSTTLGPLAFEIIEDVVVVSDASGEPIGLMSLEAFEAMREEAARFDVM